ncbi:MAG TPA: alpha/beta hydrolase [Kofleriaceae bacterium]|jgi:pimeloyl-ACP methyl ester carboxylesterase
MISAQDWIAGGHRFAAPDGYSYFYRHDGIENASTVVLFHGFPTWSYDWVNIASELSRDHQVIAPDFLGYGASDKPRARTYSVGSNADMIEGLLASIGVKNARLVIHDYGAIVGQELLDRHRNGALSFGVDSVHLMNSGVVYDVYRPTFLQRVLGNTIAGSLAVKLISKRGVRRGLDGVRGSMHPMSDQEFEETWHGMAIDDGYRLAHVLVRYNWEREQHAQRWLDALTAYAGPLQLIWGLADPVSGKHVLEALRPLVPNARVDELDGVGHFPMCEAPNRVIDALRAAL